MLAGKKILAICPARGGSKGIKLKNLRKVAGQTLIAHVGNVLQQLPMVDRAVVSTDHSQIAEEAIRVGIDSPFMRPEEISGDRVADWDVLHHALLTTESFDNTQYDIVVMLQPTSPMRTAQEVLSAINYLIENNLDSVWTISPTDSKSHPLKQLTCNPDGSNLSFYDERGKQIIARQQLQPLYHRNGVAYVMTRECLVSQKNIIGKSASAIVLEDMHISIDTEFDIELVEWVMQRAQLAMRNEGIYAE